MTENTEKLYVIGGIAGAFGLSMLSGKIGQGVLTSLGYTGKIPVEIIGGGSSETVMMSKAGYWAGLYFQLPILIVSLLAVAYYADRIEYNAEEAEA